MYAPFFVEYSAHTRMVRTFILQFYNSTLLMNNVDECYLPSSVHTILQHHFQ